MRKHISIEITFNEKSIRVDCVKRNGNDVQVQHISSIKNRPSRWEEAGLLSRLQGAIDGALKYDQPELF